MVEVIRSNYPLNPTLKLTNAEGRATDEFFRILKAVGALISNITIEDGEVTADKIAAQAIVAGKLDVGVINASNLFIDGVVITEIVAANAISELTAILQVDPSGPGGTILSGTVPVTTTGNTGMLLTFTGFMSKPTFDPANFGDWSIQLNRNGVEIDSTPPLYYDDNFSYQPVASFIDPNPGTNPLYSLTTTLHSGLGNFSVTGGVLNAGLLKR